MKPDQNTKLAELAAMPLGRLFARYSWPALVSMSLNALYAIVDRFWIGWGCGADAMAGLTLAFPLMMAFGAIGVFFGVGHMAVLSIRLGENDRIGAEKILGQMVFLKLVFSLVMPAVVFFNLDILLRLTGGAGVTPQTFAAAKEYLQIVLFSHVFSHIAFGLSGTMRAEGAAISSMLCMVVGFGTNLLLDPLFIFTFKLGIAGAGWATDIAMLASCVWALFYYRKGHSAVRLKVGRLRIYRGMLMRPLGIGLAPFLQQIIGAMIGFSMQLAFAHWASTPEEATRQMASLGVFQALMIVVVMPIMGLQQGIAPVIGYNWGARNFARVRAAAVLGFKITTLACIGAFIVQVLPPFPTYLACCFVPDTEPALRLLAAHDLALSNCMIWCIGLNVVATTYYQSIGHPRMAIFLSTLRQAGCLIPCIWILPYLFADHMFAIWLSMPISDALACLATIPPFLLQMRFLRKVKTRKVP